MADIVSSTADTAGYIAQYWAQKALNVLRAQIVLPQVVARDTDYDPNGDFGTQGKSLTIPYPGTFSAVDKVEGTPAVPQTPVGGQSVTLTLNKHKIVPFLVENFAQALARPDYMDQYIEPATIALVEQFQADLFQTAAAAGTTTVRGTATTDLTATVMRTVMADLNKAKAPQTDRSAILSPKDQAALLGDSTLATYFAFSQAEAIRNGYFGKLYGLDLFWSQQTPTGFTATNGGATSTFTYNGQTTGSLTYATLTASALQAALLGLSTVGAAGVSVSASGPTGGPFLVVFSDTSHALTASTATIAAAQCNLALHKNALIYACRPFPPAPPGSGVMQAQAHDAESGLSIRISTQYDINAVGQRMNLDLLYGSQVLRPTQAIQIVT